MKNLPHRSRLLRSLLPILVACSGLLPAQVFAQIEKDANNTALNDPASWVGGVVPGPGDLASFAAPMGTLTAGVTNNISIGADFSVLGIMVGPGGPILGQANNANGIVITNAVAANSTIGVLGITVAPTGVPFLLQGNIILGSNQTWDIADASSQITTPASGTGSANSPFGLSQHEDLAFVTTAAGQVFELAGNTLTKTNNGSVVFQAGHTVGNGTININGGTLVIQGGSTRAATINDTVTMNVAGGATLRYQSNNNAATNSFAAVNLADGSTLNMTSTNANAAVTVNGTLNTTGTTTISVTPSVGGSNTNTNYFINSAIVGNGTVNLLKTTTAANAQFNMQGDVSGFNGTFNIDAPSGNRTVNVNGNLTGAANSTWNVGTDNTLRLTNNTTLGHVTGNGNLTTSAASAVLTVGSGNFTGVLGANLSLTKVAPVSGPNVLLLGGDSPAYNGTTTISDGFIILTGNIANSTVVIESLGGLGGNGTAGAVTTLPGGRLAPDGDLSVASLLWDGATDGAATIGIELSNTSDTSDHLTVAGNLLKGSTGTTFLFDFSNTGNALGGPTVYNLITFGGITDFTAGDFSYTGLAAGLTGTFGVTAQNIILSVSPVPEPAEWAALLGACALLAALRRRRARA